MTNIKEFLIEELDAEAPATRKCLERMRADLFDWTPHEKSMKMGYVAMIVAQIPKWMSSIIEGTEIDFATFERFEGKSGPEFVAYFDKNLEEAKKALENLTREMLSEPFQLKNNGQVVATASKKDMLVPSINHMVHHRGQFTVYLKMNDIPVPAIYGPSGDEPGF